MRKDQCMHCARAGLPHRLPRARRHRPVRERHRRLPPGPVHRLRLLHDRLPVQRAEVRREDRPRLQVHAVRGSRVGGAAAGVRQGVPDQLPAVRDQGRHAARSPTRGSSSSRRTGIPQAAVYDPPGVGGTSVVTVLAFGDQPELYGLPANPTVPRAVHVLEGRAQDDRQRGHGRGHLRRGRSLHSLRTRRHHEATEVPSSDEGS